MWQSCMCKDHSRKATHTKVVMWGGVPNIVNHAKFCQNWLKSFGSLMAQNPPFSYAQRYGLYNRLGYRQTLDATF